MCVHVLHAVLLLLSCHDTSFASLALTMMWKAEIESTALNYYSYDHLTQLIMHAPSIYDTPKRTCMLKLLHVSHWLSVKITYRIKLMKHSNVKRVWILRSLTLHSRSLAPKIINSVTHACMLLISGLTADASGNNPILLPCNNP